MFFKKNSKSTSYENAKRKLRLESLEDRALLSVTPMEYAAICENYSNLELPQSIDDVNIIELDAAELDAETLQSAFDQANDTDENDVIVVRTTDDANTVALDYQALYTEVFSVDQGFVALVSFGTTNLTLDAEYNSDIFTVSDTSDARFGGITFTHGVYESFDGDEDAAGGAIYNGGQLIMEKCEMIDNCVSISCDGEGNAFGGALYNDNGYVLCYHCLFADNYAQADAEEGLAGGGAVANSSEGEIYFFGSTFESNSASSTSVAIGGAVYNMGGIAHFDNCSVVDNYVAGDDAAILWGGGVYNQFAVLEMTDTIVAGNVAAMGAGIYNDANFFDDEDDEPSFSGFPEELVFDDDFPFVESEESDDYFLDDESSTVELVNCVLTQNVAQWDDVCFVVGAAGAGLYNAYGDVVMDLCYVVENVAEAEQASSAGVHNEGGSLLMTGSLVANNVVRATELGYGAGVVNEFGGKAAFVNCTIAGNAAQGDDSYAGGIMIDLAYDEDLDESIDSPTYFFNSIVAQNFALDDANVYGNIDETSDANMIDGIPGFVVAPDFSSDGNLTNADQVDYRLSKSSLAIDAGNLAYVVDDVDLDGAARVVDGKVDLGAYELAKAPAPELFNLRAAGANSVRATVGQVANGTKYFVEYSTDPDFNTDVHKKTYTKNGGFLIDRLTPETEYYFRTYANLSDETTTCLSHVYTVTTASLPTEPVAPPTLAGFADSLTSIYARIQPYDVSVKEFQIEMSTDPDFASDVLVKTYSQVGNFVYKNLTSKTSYYLRARAVLGNSVATEYSDVLVVSTPNEADPPVISGLSAAGSNAVRLGFTKVLDASSYEVQYSTDPNFAQDVVTRSYANAGSCAISNLESSTTYYFRVRALRTVSSDTNYSDVYTVTTSGLLPETVAPPTLRVKVNSDSSVSATLGSVEATSVFAYQLEISTDADFAENVVTKTYTRAGIAKISNLTSGTYYLRLRVMLSATESTDYSDVWSVTLEELL